MTNFLNVIENWYLGFRVFVRRNRKILLIVNISIVIALLGINILLFINTKKINSSFIIALIISIII